jgi:flap endonuclease-1
MGIKKLNELLDEHCPESRKIEIPLSKFRGTRIAVDAYNWMCTNLAKAQTRSMKKTDLKNDPSLTHNAAETKKFWLESLINFCTTLCSYGITPIFVFDGLNNPEKADTQQERRERRKQIKNRVDELEQKLTNQMSHERPDEDIEKLRTLKASIFYLRDENIFTVKELLNIIGLPFINADADGERLCCALCNEGIATAVYSNDTDCIGYANPITLTGFARGHTNDNQHFVATIFNPILPKLNINYSSFLDLCILLSCDFNKNIPGIGVKKSFNLIKDHKTIENIEKAGYNIECLKYDLCKNLFSYLPSKKLLHPSHNDELPYLNVKLSKIVEQSTKNYMEEQGILKNYFYLLAAYKNLNPSQMDIGAECILGERYMVTIDGDIKMVNYNYPDQSYYKITDVLSNNVLNQIQNPLVLNQIQNPSVLNQMQNSSVLNQMQNPSVLNQMQNPSVLNQMQNPSVLQPIQQPIQQPYNLQNAQQVPYVLHATSLQSRNIKSTDVIQTMLHF